MGKRRKLQGLALKTQCEECGKFLGRMYVLPTGFRVICQECYEDFKHRRPPEQMHYRKKIPKEIMLAYGEKRKAMSDEIFQLSKTEGENKDAQS